MPLAGSRRRAALPPLPARLPRPSRPKHSIDLTRLVSWFDLPQNYGRRIVGKKQNLPSRQFKSTPGRRGIHHLFGEAGPGKTARSEEDQAQPGGVDDSFSAALDAQLAQNSIDVKLDRVLADFQTLGDGLIGQSLRHKPQHLKLSESIPRLAELAPGFEEESGQPPTPDQVTPVPAPQTVMPPPGSRRLPPGARGRAHRPPRRQRRELGLAPAPRRARHANRPGVPGSAWGLPSLNPTPARQDDRLPVTARSTSPAT